MALGQIHSGTVTGVGVASMVGGRGHASLRLAGVFAFHGRIDVTAAGAEVTILTGLDAGGNGGELVQDTRLALTADRRNTTNAARFKTARGETPAAAVLIGRRGRDQFNFILDMNRATITVPEACSRLTLATTMQIDDGTNPPLVVAFKEPWQCVSHGAKVERLKTP